MGMDLSTNIITTEVGTLGVYGSSGDGGPATSATIGVPGGLDFDHDNMDMYIADYLYHGVRKVDGHTGIISTFAGQPGLAEWFGDGGLATKAGLPHAGNLMVHPITKDVFIVNEAPVNVVRRVSKKTGKITTVAGIPCQQGFSGHLGPATKGLLNFPNAMVYYPITKGVILSDGANGALRLLTTV